jgi:polysaccharide export outer membrane protein
VNLIKTFIALFFCFLMTACAVIPGSHFEGIDPTFENQSVGTNLDNINIRIIDSALITQQKSANTKPDLMSNDGLPKQSTNVYEYQLGVGDVLNIQVWEHPELAMLTGGQSAYEVQPDGTINFPYAQQLQVEDASINDVRRALTSKLAAVIQNPQVDVKVVAFNSQKAYVTGAVGSPGLFPITTIPLTLIDVLGMAGGLNADADWNSVIFSRKGKKEKVDMSLFYNEGRVDQNRLLEDGDIVHVNGNEQSKVFVLGEVGGKGAVNISRYGLSLAEALTLSGGLNEGTANANGIFVFRARNYEEAGIIADVYQLHAKNIIALVLADQFELQTNDIIYVTSAPIARWNKVLSLILPSVQSVKVIEDLTTK